MAKEVEVKTVKFISVDGETYDTKEAAEYADEEWKEYNDFAGVDAEVDRYCQTGLKNYKAKKKRDVGQEDTIYLLVTHEKYGANHFLGKGVDGLFDCYMQLMKDRLRAKLGEYHYCLTPRQLAIAEGIMEKDDKYGAYQFVKGRSYYEYEELSEHVIPHVFGMEK